MRCFLAMRLASFSRKKAARARCSRGGASMCEVRSGCAKVERGACGPRWHGCSFVSYAAATPPGDSMHISHNLARGPPSSEIAISHISRDLPHAHLPQSRTGTTVPGDCDLAHLARSPACTFFPRRGSTDWASIDCHCDRPRKAFRVLLHLSFTLWTRPCARTSSARATRQR